MTEPRTGTAQIRLAGVSHGYGNRFLLQHISLAVAPGEHIAIVGENGAGKSTLLRLIAGLEMPDDGSVTVGAAAGLLPQSIGAHRMPGSYAQNPLAADLPGAGGQELWHSDEARATVGSAIDSALSGLRELERRIHGLESRMADARKDELAQYAALAAEFEARGGYRADSRVDSALDHLGMGGLERSRELETMSGGEQERLALACLLADPPPILLLDEPTNHLDDDAVDWLERQLAGHSGTVVAVSHDRTFLARVATAVLEVDADACQVRRYGNGYLGYLGEKAAERQRWELAYQQWLDALEAQRRQAESVASSMGYARRRDGDKMAFGYKSGTWEHAATSKIRNARERLRRLQESPVDRPPEPLRLGAGLPDPALPDPALPDPALPKAGSALTVRDVVVPGRLDVPELDVASGEKLLITGPNGAGKTTLLDVLAGIARPEAGSVRRQGRLGYLPQELAPPSNPDLRLLPAFAAGRAGDMDSHAETLLRLGLFRSTDFHLPVGSLSAGQYRRLALARLLADRFDVLLFDEPTNHLAPLLVGELEEALADFAGTLVMVSHDRALRGWFAGLERGRRLGMERGRLRRAAETAETMSVEPPRP